MFALARRAPLYGGLFLWLGCNSPWQAPSLAGFQNKSRSVSVPACRGIPANGTIRANR
jgi:hypothetical protein